MKFSKINFSKLKEGGMMSSNKIYEKFILKGVEWLEGGITPSNTVLHFLSIILVFLKFS